MSQADSSGYAWMQSLLITGGGRRLTQRAWREHFRSSAGYSLIELLVVIAIISLLVGLVGPRAIAYLGDSRVKTAKLQVEGFNSALDLFFMDVGRYPSASEGLKALVQKPDGVETWAGPYLKGNRVPPDPWGNAYQYRAAAAHTPPFEIVSLGSDGAEGGTGSAADISTIQR
jgi:general secretion pathway protein G